jgi:hypothetical protein
MRSADVRFRGYSGHHEMRTRADINARSLYGKVGTVKRLRARRSFRPKGDTTIY